MCRQLRDHPAECRSRSVASGAETCSEPLEAFQARIFLVLQFIGFWLDHGYCKWPWCQQVVTLARKLVMTGWLCVSSQRIQTRVLKVLTLSVSFCLRQSYSSFSALRTLPGNGLFVECRQRYLVTCTSWAVKDGS